MLSGDVTVGHDGRDLDLVPATEAEDGAGETDSARLAAVLSCGIQDMPAVPSSSSSCRQKKNAEKKWKISLASKHSPRVTLIRPPFTDHCALRRLLAGTFIDIVISVHPTSP